MTDRTAVPPRLGPVAILAIAGLAFLYYLLILTGPSLRITAPTVYSLNFNSMLDHMLRGMFDVDPAYVREEGFVRDGRTYTYFGPFMALPRLPLVPFGALMEMDITRVSIAFAAALAVAGKLGALDAAFPPPARIGHGRRVFLLLVAVVPLSGLQLQLLLPLMFHEVTSWAYAFLILFLSVALRGLVDGGFGPGRLALLGLLAGLALLTRVSTGISLYAATGLLGLVLLWRAWRAPGGGTFGCARVLAGLVPAGLLLAAGLALVLFINRQRWGDWLTFMPSHLQLTTEEFAYRRAVLDRYGDFHPTRILFNLQYYFLPVWGWVRDGRLIMADFMHTRMLMVEMPIGTPLLSDPLALYLAGLFVAAAACGRASWDRGRGVLARTPALAVLSGLGLGAAVMLFAAASAYRYRVDVLAPLEWAALLGVAAMAAAGPVSRRRLVLLAVLGVATVVLGHLFMVLHITAHLGSAEEALRAPTMLQEMYWRLFTGWRRWP